MQWTEVSLQTTHEQADTIADILYSAGAQGVAMEDPLLINQLRASGTWELCDIPEQQNTEVVTVTAYYPDDEKLSERLEFISREVKAVEERIGQNAFSAIRCSVHCASRIGQTSGSSIST